GPLQLGRDVSRSMDLDDDVVDRRRRLRPLSQGHSGSPRSQIRHHDRLHLLPPQELRLDYFVHPRTASDPDSVAREKLHDLSTPDADAAQLDTGLVAAVRGAASWRRPPAT